MVKIPKTKKEVEVMGWGTKDAFILPDDDNEEEIVEE